MGCRDGGVNTLLKFLRPTRSVDPRHAWMGAAAGLQAKKIPAEARSFFVGAQKRTRTSTVLPAST